MGQASPRLSALGAALLIVLPDSPERARKVAKLLRAGFPVLADPARRVFRSYGLGRRLLFVQQSGTALVDENGLLAYLHRSTSPRTALDLDALMRELEKPGRA